MDKKQNAEKVPVFVPKQSKDDNSLFVSVNGKRILIQKGKTVMVEPMFAEVINNSMKQSELNEEYITEKASK
ncbi:MAG: hypothetical protein J1E34_10080 [Oscillospiraceae bacterium]|nr:hypothetical protein [Oscillospiraceae bacterium]